MIFAPTGPISRPCDAESLRIDDLEFSARVRNALAQSGVRTLRELSALTQRDLLRSPNVGRKSLLEIVEVLARFGLCLGMTPDAWQPAPATASLAKKGFELNTFLEECRRRACAWYREIAQRGCPSAHNLLGYMHQLGIGTQRDRAQARHHYLTAARMGYSLAIYNLGLMELEEAGTQA